MSAAKPNTVFTSRGYCGFAKCLAMLAFLTACTPSTQIFVPPGVAMYASASAAARDGLFVGSKPSQCCFLAGKARLTLEKGPGSRAAIFKVYVPNIAEYEKAPIRISIQTSGAPRQAYELLAGIHYFKLKFSSEEWSSPRIVASIAASPTFVPKKSGLGNDSRNLSVIVLFVRFEGTEPFAQSLVGI